MPKHDIGLDFKNQAIWLSKVDTEVIVRSDGVIRGRLRISRGTIDWYPRLSKNKRHSLSWERFADLMEAQTESPRTRKKVAH